MAGTPYLSNNVLRYRTKPLRHLRIGNAPLQGVLGSSGVIEKLQTGVSI
jgi:hypothetical protein